MWTMLSHLLRHIRSVLSGTKNHLQIKTSGATSWLITLLELHVAPSVRVISRTVAQQVGCSVIHSLHFFTKQTSEDYELDSTTGAFSGRRLQRVDTNTHKLISKAIITKV
ncbi:hypothetical protein AMECASPLE_030476 [Ameca splendens]|uniref:Uncharacterized protein n=1 Tax=Ameca splendens TaxID=208324 RepID=A0ABV0ZES1_9TELE